MSTREDARDQGDDEVDPELPEERASTWIYGPWELERRDDLVGRPGDVVEVVPLTQKGHESKPVRGQVVVADKSMGQLLEYVNADDLAVA